MNSQVLSYIRDEAPLVIHIHLDRHIDKLLADTHYRNQFDTKTSCGTLSEATRIEWEVWLLLFVNYKNDQQH